MTEYLSNTELVAHPSLDVTLPNNLQVWITTVYYVIQL